AGRKYAVSLCAGLEQNANTLSIIDVWKLGWTDGEDIADQDSLPADFLDNAIPVAEWLQPDEMVRIEQDQKLASLQDTIVELAGLNAQSYELRRSDAAEALGIRAAQLDTFVSDKRQELHPSPQDGQGQKLVLEDPEPWHEPVDGHGLAEYVRDTFKRHCILPAGAAEALTLFTFHTHCFEVADFSPHLILMSAVKRSGKTTVLHVLSQLVSKPLKVEHCTTSAIFRSIELAAPTLLIDEGDSFIKENEQIRGLLNSSFERGGGVLRVEGDEREPRLFRTFTPTAIATIKELPGTIMDRAIVIPMKRKSTNETIEKFRRPSRSKCTPLTKKLRRWAEDNINNLREVKVNFPSSLHDRAADACEPLLQIATLLNWEREAHEMIKSLLDIEEFEGDLGLELLADIKSLIPAGVEKFTSEWLRFELAELEGQPWASYSSKETISQLHLSKLLKPFDIRPKQFRLDDKTRKRSDQTKINYRGYKTAWFEDSWARYVLPEDTVEPATSATPATSPVNTDSLLATERSGYTEPATQKSASLPDVAPIPATPANPVAGTDPVEMQVVAGVAGVAGLKGLPEVQCPVTGVGIPIVYVADAAEAASRLQSMLSSGGIYGADTETQPRSGHEDEPKAGLSPATGKLRLVQITDGEQVLVLDMNHIPATILGVLSDARLVFHNVQFDLAFLLDAGIRIKRPACTQLAVAALTHDPMVSLANACKEYLGIEIQKDQQTSDWTLSELSPKQIEYASLDAVLTLSLYNALTMKINMQGYRQVRQCIPAIADASHRGVLIDRQKHQALVNKWQQEKKEAVGRLRSLVGEDVNLESGKQLSDWLRDNLDGVEWPETPKGQLRTDKDTLEAFSHVELVQPLLDYRRVSHRLKTWGETYQRHMTEDNRLHPNFLLLGARSGRMSCRNPNVQNIPRDEAFRACFIAPDGYRIVTADFSQIELRIAGILSGDTVILNAYSDGKDLHKAIVARVTGKPEHEISADERKLGKALNFGLLYG
ncbi:MAG: DNA polymerase, partial [Gammaproteobacteria bacterium]|nr:DNA polymerase [Gammaproteobacteria bacterium]